VVGGAAVRGDAGGVLFFDGAGRSRPLLSTGTDGGSGEGPARGHVPVAPVALRTSPRL